MDPDNPTISDIRDLIQKFLNQVTPEDEGIIGPMVIVYESTLITDENNLGYKTGYLIGPNTSMTNVVGLLKLNTDELVDHYVRGGCSGH